MLSHRAKANSGTCEITDSLLDSLSLEGCDRYTSIQDRRHAIVHKDIQRNLSENVVGSKVLKNVA
jgi:hypothetical protein